MYIYGKVPINSHKNKLYVKDLSTVTNNSLNFIITSILFTTIFNNLINFFHFSILQRLDDEMRLTRLEYRDHVDAITYVYGYSLLNDEIYINLYNF